jgi:hypothetical protein
MDFALVTTTIGVPDVLRSYRELSSDVEIVIAGDRKSPHADIVALCKEIGGTYLDPDVQAERYPGLSDAIGWNSIQRRNLAVLEAARRGPDVIISIDDDNAPTGDYFAELEQSFSSPPGYIAEREWFNLGEFCSERYRYRGYPYSEEPIAEISPNGQAPPIGVVNGAILGDPDINATERLERNPRANEYEKPVHDGIALDPNRTWSPINSQNTAWRAELGPLAMVLPGLGRYDDVWASFIAQRVMAGTGHHVLFGRPFVHQDRNPHDLLLDLENEIYGMRATEEFCARLKEIDVASEGPLGRLDEILRQCRLPDATRPFCQQWTEAWGSL